MNPSGFSFPFLTEKTLESSNIIKSNFQIVKNEFFQWKQIQPIKKCQTKKSGEKNAEEMVKMRENKS